MRIQRISTQPNFNGKVYTAANLTIRDMEKLEKGASKINAFAETRNCDFIICKGVTKGISVLAKKIDTKKECMLDVLGYPSGSVMNDIDRVIDTMKEADDSFTKSKVALGWVCE